MTPTPSEGGYIVTRTPLIRTGFSAHSAALDMPVSPLALTALNTIQSTAWRINRFVLDTLSKAFADGLPIAGIATETPPTVPPRMDTEVWEALEAVDKKAHTDRLRDIHADRASILGRRNALLDKIMVAEELRDEIAIWFPHALDFRGRIYPIPVSGPHPQSDDVGKALLMFADGVPLGEDGLFWLYVRAANCFGMDKLPLEGRAEWTLSNLARIQEAAASPLTSQWWTQADEPWSFLASCCEVLMVGSTSHPETFVSHLPVPMDGSCNGLQHLSAMGLDPVGAAATNLRPGPRQDIYEEVAKRVRSRVEADAAKCDLNALHWNGKIGRKVVKRAVMTTPYGVTNGGIRTQLVADGSKEDWFEGLTPGKGGTQGPAADYLRDRLVEALEETIQSGKAIMAWLQATAMRLANAGLPFDWTTPTGSKCRQAYYATSVKRIDTLLGRLDLHQEHQTVTLTPRKQALGSAPNLVHSFDAAHLSLTAVAASQEGLTSFAFIHDSFGTHAGNTSTLARLLRETFVGIYSEDWLERIYQEIREYAPHVAIDRPPERGLFDVAEVLEAEFFFS